MQACIAIDWLQIFVILPPNWNPTENTKFSIKKEAYQTRHFKSIFTILKGREEIAVLACHPHSNILQTNGGLLKVVNKQLYQSNLYDFVVTLLKDLNFTFKSISRLDVAMDFNRFHKNLNPEKFIEKFMSKQYLKIGKAKGSNQFTVDKKITYTGLSFGAESSDVKYYLYNKSSEMEQVKLKPWIVEHWQANGHLVGETVWRLEFSLKLSTKAFGDAETGILLSTKNLDVIKVENVKALYQLVFNHYFKFVYKSKSTRKDRMKPITLLSIPNANPVKIKLSDKIESTRSSKIFAKQLMRLNQELRGHDFNLSLMTSDLMNYFILNRKLEPWAHKKLPDFRLNERSFSFIPNSNIY